MDGSSDVKAPERGVIEMEVELKPRSTDDSAEQPQEASSKASSPRRESPQAPLEELCADQPLEQRIESLLMTTDRAIPESRLAEILGIAGKGASKRVVAAIEALNHLYSESNRSFRAERLAGGWQLLTLPAFGPLLHRLHEKRQETRLSQPALETLAIVAYRQPIMRAEIEAIRGVASGEVLRSLLERRLVKITGRAEVLGRPMLYGTTSEFLKVFGLANTDDLPQVKGLTMPPMAQVAAPASRAASISESDPPSSSSDA